MSIIVNDNIQSNSSKSLDNKYMVDGVTPYADVAEVNSIIPLTYRSKGLTVLILNQEYWYRDGVADGDLILKGVSGGYSPPIVRYVYLVNDASDEVRMGGALNNVYLTAQEAYDAGNVLQVLLGGLNKVIIKVGVTNSSDVGGVAITETYNTLVEWVGESSTLSVIGTISSGTNAMNIKLTNVTTGIISSTTGALTITAIYSTLGSVINTGGATVTLTLRNSSMTAINTTNTTGDTGNISILNSSNSTITAITATSALGNIGSLTYSSCSNITTGATSMTQTSTIDSFSIGAFTMTNCDNCRFTSTTTITMAFATSTGTIGGLVVGITNQNILFVGNVRITAYANNSNIASDNVISNILLFNCTFGALFINNRTAGSNNWEGGIVTSLNIQKCVFRSRTRIAYNNITAITTGLTYRISDCIFKGTTDGLGLDFYTINTDVSFDSFVISNCQSNFQFGFAVVHNAFVPPTVPFIIDGVSIILNNLAIDVFYGDFTQPIAPNSVYDIVVSGGVYSVFEVVINGDMNVNFSETEVTNSFYLVNNTAPSLKRTLVSGSNLVMNNGSAYGVHFYNVPIFIRNSYMSYYTNILNTLTQDIISYNSFIESFAETGSVTTWTGTINTSTLKRLVTDSVVGVTFNNSYDEAI
jgi:hypothetical protein